MAYGSIAKIRLRQQLDCCSHRVKDYNGFSNRSDKLNLKNQEGFSFWIFQSHFIHVVLPATASTRVEVLCGVVVVVFNSIVTTDVNWMNK